MRIHKSINVQDVHLFEDLETKYTPDELADTIKQISSSNNTALDSIDEDNQVGTDMKTAVLEYIMKIEGYRTRLREIHWQAKRHTEHDLTDGFIGDLTEFEDSVAEQVMGVLGYRIKVGEVRPVLPDATTFDEILVGVEKDTIVLRASADDRREFYGLNSMIDDFLEHINKIKYLNTFE